MLPMTSTRLAVCVVLALLCLPAQADKGDRDQPTNIESDRLQYDDLKQTTVFTGNVILTKGTIMIRGDSLVLRQFPGNMQTALATGGPASFKQKRDGVDQYVEGRASEIQYDSRNESVRLVGNAIVKRLECDVATNEITGGVIVYNARTEQVNVDGKAPGESSGRVRIIIQPRTDAGTLPSGSVADGTRSAPSDTKGKATKKCPTAPPLALQPSDRLEPARGAAAVSR